jgi:hypothetical protein
MYTKDKVTRASCKYCSVVSSDEESGVTRYNRTVFTTGSSYLIFSVHYFYLPDSSSLDTTGQYLRLALVT